MASKNFFITFILLFSYISIWAREVTDTLESSMNDRVIITYNIVQKDGKVTIEFYKARTILGRTNRDKYKKIDKVAVVFFDKIGIYEDNTVFSGIETRAFMRPKGVKFSNESGDGYYLIKDRPKLSIELKSVESIELSIPLYLANYEGKQRYEVFSRCDKKELKINLSKKKSVREREESTLQMATQTITTQEEMDGTDVNVIMANKLIISINELLDKQDRYPFTDALSTAINQLRDISIQPIDNNLSSRICEVLSACDQKEEELKAKAKAAEETAAKNAEIQAKLAEEQAQARQDSIAAVVQQKAEEERKQNLWLIVGGVILAVLAFVGNQTFQHFRNVKNQKSIMDMQQNVVRCAEDEAKRRAQSMTRNQINRVQGEAKRKTRNALNDGIGKIGKKEKGNKGISI